MAEFVYRGEKIIETDEPITLENNTDASLDVSIGVEIIFQKSGLYRVSVDSKHTSIQIIEPERKKGKWIDEGQYAEGHSEHAYRCSECEEHYIGWVGEFKFCPNCGSYNGGEER